MPPESTHDIMDLESANHTLEEKFLMAHKILTNAMKINVPQVQEIFLWFLNRKEELMRQKKMSREKLDLLFQHLLKCLQTHQISILSVYQLKFNIVENLFQILNVKENTISTEVFIKCCLSILNIDNFVKCLEQDPVLFIKYSTCSNWLFSLSEDETDNKQTDDHIKEKVELLNKIVSIIKKIKWNACLSVHEMTHALVCVATLDYWNNVCQEQSSDIIHLTLEQVFYSVATKDGSLCGILLTSFHDEGILTKPEYIHIFDLISSLELIPIQQKGHITGIIYTLLLNATYKLSEEYYGKVSCVFEKLDSFIRKDIDEYEANENIEVTPIVQIEPFDHWNKMVLIYKHISEFLVKNNISTGLPIKKGETLEDLCTKVCKCIMYVLYRLHVSDDCSKVRKLMDKCYSVLLSLFSFAPYVAVKTFPFFKRFVIYTQNRIEQTKMYGTVFAAILNIHFKLSKEVLFLETLLRPEPLRDIVLLSESCWLPVNAYKTALYQVFSSVSSERIMSGWFSCIVSHFNIKYLKESQLTPYYDFDIYCVCTTLVCTLEVTLLMKTPLGDSSVLNKQRQYLQDIKQQLGSMRTILLPLKTNSSPYITYVAGKRSMMMFGGDNKARVFLCFLEIATYWGMFNMMCTEYNRMESVDKNLGLLRTGDHALYLLHDYFNLQEWRELSRIITTVHKDDTHIKNAFSELLAQSLDMLESYVNINRKHSPTEVTSKFLVDNSDKTWLLGRAHLVHSYLNTRDQWKLAKKLSKHLIQQEDPLSLLTNNANLHELNVMVFEIAFWVLKLALIKAYDEATDIGRAVVLLECQEEEIRELAIHEDKQSFLKKLWKTTEDTTADSSDDNTASTNSECDESESEDENKEKIVDENNSKRKCPLVEDSDDPSESFKKRKVDGNLINIILVTYLKEIKSTNLPRTDLSKYISIIEHLPVQYLEPSSQHLLFILVIICSRVSCTDITSLIDSFILGKDFSIPHCDIMPFLLEILQNAESKISVDQVLKKLFKLCMQGENTIQVISKSCELTKKKCEDIDVHLLISQCQVTVHFLNELTCSKTSNKNIIPLKNKLISRAYKNYKSLKIEPSKHTLLLFTFMLQKSLKDHDNQSVQVLSENLNTYLDIALEVQYTELIETALTYAALSLKNYLPLDFIPKVWNKLPLCANLCFQAASLVQFNQFLEEIFQQLSNILEHANTNLCDLNSLETNFNLWRKLLSSHLSSHKFSSRLAKLEAVITSFSTHITLYMGSNIQHFSMILELVLDIVNSQAFIICGNTSSVHALFNLMTPKSCVYFKPCMKLLQYFITKKSSIISDETALFLLKYHALLTQITKYVCRVDTSSAERDVLLLGMGKIAHAIRKEKKHFQRVVPYTLSNIMHLYLTNKFPIDVTVHMNEISNTFISICDEHGIHFLKHSLPDSSKQIFLQTLQSYTKYHSQRFM